MRHGAVLLDLFGTLVPQIREEDYAACLAAMAASCGLPADAFSEEWSATWRERTTGVYASAAENVAAVCARLNALVDDSAMRSAATERRAWLGRWLTPRSDAVRTLEALRGHGVPLGLVSDSAAEVPEVWPQTPLAPLFSASVFSCQEGTKKPDSRLFLAACRRLGVAPSQCTYVADGFSGELAAARGLGMRAVFLRDPAEPLFFRTDWEGDCWRGPRIARLTDLLALLGIPANEGPSERPPC